MSLADELEKVLDEREEKEAELTPIKEREEQIREALLEGMSKKGYRFVKTTSGLGFGVQERKTLSIKDGMEDVAFDYFKENYPAALTLHKPTVNKIIKPMLEFPHFIEESITKYLSVRTAENDD